jgi:hypothetical protein
MPFGGTIAGIAYFAGIKLAGYSAAAVYVNRAESLSRPSPLVVSATRTAIGVAAGMTCAFALGKLAITNSEFVFYGGLIPL